MKQKQVFLSSQESSRLLPDLFYDLLLVDGSHPVLFTCVNEDETMTYLVGCYQSDQTQQAWNIVPCPLPRLQELLEDKITLRAAFGGDQEELYILKRRQKEQVCQLIPTKIKAGQENLPTAGYYLDPDEGEFDEELAILTRRQEKCVTIQQRITVQQAQLIRRPERVLPEMVSSLKRNVSVSIPQITRPAEKTSSIAMPFSYSFSYAVSL